MAEDDVRQQNERRIAERFSMNGRKALVTGGSLSIGREIAVVFAEAGADVAVHSARSADATFGDPSAAEETLSRIAACGVKGVAIDADFANPGEARRCVEDAILAFGGLDILVICASIQYRVPFEEITDEQIDRQIQVNFRATIELLRAILPHMKTAGFGRILTIGSVNQTAPESFLSVYAALKSAQHNLVINLAKEYARCGITINNLSPGLVATERNRWRREDMTAWKQIEQGSSPMRRAGAPREIAGPALLLCSEAGSFITGADLQVTGGRHLA
jgi:NAD(P)-dependent dehydrogenase (short-subunit alcohol dehydrogenase family)